MIYDLSTLYDREFSEGSLETAALIAIAERLDALIEAGGNYRLIDSISGLSSQLCEINQRQTAEHRSLQICALPEMVALLQEIGTNDTWSREEIMHKAANIRKKIGEAE